MTDHPFPLPWIVKEITGGFAVIDARGTTLSHVYVRKGQLEREEARQLALTISRIPALVAGVGGPAPAGSTQGDLAWWNGSLAPN